MGSTAEDDTSRGLPLVPLSPEVLSEGRRGTGNPEKGPRGTAESRTTGWWFLWNEPETAGGPSSSSSTSQRQFD